MERLSFELPQFTRVAWVSDAAKAVWEPRLRRVSDAWLDVEWLAAAEGVRACGLTFAGPERFIELARDWARRGLCGLPVDISGDAGTYISRTIRYEQGRPFVFRIAVGKPEAVAEFQRSWDSHDESAIGGLLGYPPCCTDFFREVWVEQGLSDTTWPMAAATAPAADCSITVGAPPQPNLMWRWLGLRAVPHLPCRFDCPASVALGDRLLAVGRENGYQEEMDWLLEVLSWPVEWSALHGIAEVKTPILKLVAQTDATAQKYTVRYLGDRYPELGARGLSFPYQRPSSLKLTESPGYRRGLRHAVGV